MSDPKLEALLQRIERSIAREIETGVDNPVMARLYKIRGEIARECDYDFEKYARYMREQAEAFEREMDLNLKHQNKLAESPAKMVAQKGGKGA